MFESDDMPLPKREELRELLRKARFQQPFTSSDYLWLVNIMATLERDPSYKLKQRMREYEKEDSKPVP